MSLEGLQTKDFRDRMAKERSNLPNLIVELAEVLDKMIEEIERPTRADIARLHARMRELIGSKENLINTCGNEGKLCAICPFMAYVPTDIQYASESQPICLPWIALNRA
jgi:hypothetical protein